MAAEVVVDQLLEEVQSLRRAVSGLAYLGDDYREIKRQLQTLQGGSGALEPLSLVSGWQERFPRTTPPTTSLVGEGQLLLAGTGITFTRVANTPFLRIDGSSSECWDYIIRTDGNGTHTTFAAMMADFLVAAAAGTDVVKTCLVCTDLTELNVEISGASSSIGSAKLYVQGKGSELSDGNATLGYRYFLKVNTPAANDGFIKATNAYCPQISFRNLRLTTTDSAGATVHAWVVWRGTGAKIRPRIDLYDCELQLGVTSNTNVALADYNGSSSGDTAAVRLFRVGGQVGTVYRFTNGGTPGSLQLYDTQGLTVRQISQDDNQGLSDLILEGGFIQTEGYGFNHTAGSTINIILKNLLIRHRGATTWLRTASAQIGPGIKTSIQSVRYSQASTSSAVQFANFALTGAGTFHEVFADDLHGLCDGANSGTFMTIATSYNTQIGTVYADRWTTALSGGSTTFYAPPTFTGLPLTLSGNYDGLTTQSGLVLNSTGTENMNMAFQRSGTLKGQIGLWDTTAPATFVANDLYFSTNDGSAHNVAAFANDGSAFKLNTNFAGNGWLSLQSATFAAPLNTTAGDASFKRLLVGTDAAIPSGTEAYVNGDGMISGYLGVGISAAPLNTTAGDITGQRLVIGTDTTLLGSGRTIASFSGTTTGILTSGLIRFTHVIAPDGNGDSGTTALFGTTITPTADTNSVATALTGLAQSSGTFNIGGIVGLNFSVAAGSTGTVGTLQGITVLARAGTGVGNVTTMSGGSMGIGASTSGFASTVTTGNALSLSLGGSSATFTITSLTMLDFSITNAGSLTTTTRKLINIPDFNAGTSTDFIGIDIAQQTAGSGITLGLRLADRLAFTPSSAQTISAAGNTILANATVVQLTNTTGGNITLTSTPTIADGQDGQIVHIINVGTDAVTLQDQGTLASSNLRLAAATVALGARDSVILMYSATIGDWIQIGQTNVV